MRDLSTVSGLLENAATGDGVVGVFTGEREEIGIGELWRRSERAAAWFLDTVGRGGAAGLLMETSLDCLVTLLGAWRAGITTLSLPYPARSAAPGAYRQQLLDIGRAAGMELVLGKLELDGAMRTASFRECAAHQRRADVADPGEFVQFSSGSTGRPKGARLSSQAIAANVTAMIDHMVPHNHGAVAFSWLPLSHDMGLVGTCLTILASMGPPWRSRRLVLMPPERMVARPSRWLQACSELGATVTCAPSFALDLVLAHSRAVPAGLDLRPLRVLTVGSELIAAGTLRRFARAMAPLGFDEAAFCPAYGMAEASLAVTMVPPGKRWQATADDVVSCGVPLRGLEVTAPAGGDAASAGPIAVRGTSLLSGYLGQGTSPVDAGGWLATSDLGFLSGGELHVVGRADDVLVLAGRKFAPEPLEETASRHETVRSGNCAAIADGSGGYVIVAERRRASARADLREACRWIRHELSVRRGAAPTAVIIVSPGSMPRTPSGKLQRKRLGQLRRRGELAVETELRFR